MTDSNNHDQSPQKWRVMVETHQGTVHCIRKGFTTKDDAEAHPVVLSYWKRVWVEEEPQIKLPSSDPKLPWSPSTDTGRGLSYIKDASGRCIMTLLGRPALRDNIIKILRERGLMDDSPSPPENGT